VFRVLEIRLGSLARDELMYLACEKFPARPLVQEHAEIK
jgi:hypothetical protein